MFKKIKKQKNKQKKTLLSALIRVLFVFVSRQVRVLSASSPRLVRVKSASDGFSLVEMLVAVGIFMSIMTLAITALITIISANKKAQLIKSTIDSVTFVVEDISRNMRMGTEYQCWLESESIFSSSTEFCSIGKTKIKYKNINGKEVIYKFDKTLPEIFTRKVGIESEETLISKDANVNIDNMTFYVIGADTENAPQQIDKTQPRVIITVSGKISTKGSANTAFNLQTSISQRARK